MIYNFQNDINLYHIGYSKSFRCNYGRFQGFNQMIKLKKPIEGLETVFDDKNG